MNDLKGTALAVPHVNKTLSFRVKKIVREASDLRSREPAVRLHSERSRNSRFLHGRIDRKDDQFAWSE